MEMLYVMLVWAVGQYGGPSTIQGFDSLKACDANRPVVERVYKQLGHSAETACVGLRWESDKPQAAPGRQD